MNLVRKHRSIVILTILFLVAILTAIGYLETIPKNDMKLIEGPSITVAAEPNQPAQVEAAMVADKTEAGEKCDTSLPPGETYVVTAYDLSEGSCGKTPEQLGYGITATGVDLSGETWETARAVAVDPRYIPLGSKVLIAFENKAMEKFNGVYTAVDTGGGVRGNHIDFFYGDYGNHTPEEIWQFGRQKAEVIILA